MSLILIRRAGRRDLDAIVRIEEASFDSDVWDRDLFREYLEGCGDLFLVAKLDGRLAGYSIACVEEKTAEIDSIAVLPRFRGRGVARALLRETMSALRRRRVPACYLTVRRTNRDAISLYRRFGFVRTRTVPRYYSDGEHGWLMTRLILR